jgi:hypothetical protein
MTGLASGRPLQVKYCVALRIESPPINQERGPIKDFVVKVFPKGLWTFPGIILGMPACDVVPYGLGFRINANTYSLDALGGLQLPRLDLSRRDAMHSAMRVYSACDDDAHPAGAVQAPPAQGAKKGKKSRAKAWPDTTNTCSCLWEVNLAGPQALSKALLGVHELHEAEKSSRAPVGRGPQPGSSTKSGTGSASEASDVSSWKSLCEFDGPPLIECVADCKDPVLLAPGDVAEIPVVFTNNVARDLVDALLEVRRSPLSPVDVVRGVFSPDDVSPVLIVVNSEEDDVWVNLGDVVGWAFKPKDAVTACLPQEDSREPAQGHGAAPVNTLVETQDPSQVLRDGIPPDEFFDLLTAFLIKEFPDADAAVVEHVVSLERNVWHACTFGLSYKAAKVQLARALAKMLGEYLGRGSRVKDPEKCEGIRNFPPPQELKQP